MDGPLHELWYLGNFWQLIIEIWKLKVLLYVKLSFCKDWYENSSMVE